MNDKAFGAWVASIVHQKMQKSQKKKEQISVRLTPA